MKIINMFFVFHYVQLSAACQCSVRGDKECDVFRKCITEDNLAAISYLLTVLLLKQRRVEVEYNSRSLLVWPH